MPIARMLLSMAGNQLSFVGFTTGTTGTSLSLSSLGLQPGDLVYAWSTVDYDDSSTRPSSPTTGWSVSVSNLYSSQLNTYAVRKVMGETPDSSVTLKTSSTYGVMMAVAFRGLHPETPFVAGAVAQSTYDPPAVETTYSQGISLAIVLCARSLTVSASPPSGWTYIGDATNTAGYDTATGSAYRVLAEDGSWDPGAFTGLASTYEAALHFLFR